MTDFLHQPWLQQNWMAAVGVLLIALALLWWVLTQRAPDRRRRYQAPDALDEGAAPAQRNQAFINAPSATTAALAGTGPDIFGGIGEVIAAAAAHEVEAAQDAGQGTTADALAPEAPIVPAGDDLTRIKGLGPKLASRLAELGITRFAQIAAWDQADLARIDGQLGAFAGRPARDLWVEQAGFLAAADTAGYEAKFGKL
ncbi:MAG: hypothetical protein KGN34_11185 [Sphingomonadales bacterium]|nr:hypothetical protein [Sphingomonadales bacterium]